MNSTETYFAQTVNFGGVPTTVASVIAQLQAEGHPQRCIDAWLMGALR